MNDETMAKLYIQRRPLPESHAQILSEIADRSGKSVAQVRAILISRRVYKSGKDFKSPLDRERDEKLSRLALEDRERRRQEADDHWQSVKDSLARTHDRLNATKPFSQVVRDVENAKTPMLPIEVMAIVGLLALAVAGVTAIFH